MQPPKWDLYHVWGTLKWVVSREPPKWTSPTWPPVWQPLTCPPTCHQVPPKWVHKVQPPKWDLTCMRTALKWMTTTGPQGGGLPPGTNRVQAAPLKWLPLRQPRKWGTTCRNNEISAHTLPPTWTQPPTWQRCTVGCPVQPTITPSSPPMSPPGFLWLIQNRPAFLPQLGTMRKLKTATWTLPTRRATLPITMRT